MNASSAPDLGDVSHQFLVHTDTGQVVLKSRSHDQQRLLLAHADYVLYDPELELVWFLDEPRLSILDMRDLSAPPVLIARGLPTVGHLSVSRSGHLAETEDNCDIPSISLEWSTTPTVEAFYVEAPEARIENVAWLRAQLQRPRRKVGERHNFGKARVAWPRKLSACEDAAACGASLPFGARGLQLVQVVQKMGGDCWARACVLRNPGNGLFATPPAAHTWGRPEQTAKGPCGPFMFNQAQSSFLVDHTLCVADGPCNDVGGLALGWVIPGDTVGAPGVLPE